MPLVENYHVVLSSDCRCAARYAPVVMGSWQDLPFRIVAAIDKRLSTVVLCATFIKMATLGSNGRGYRTRALARVVKGLKL